MASPPFSDSLPVPPGVPKRQWACWLRTMLHAFLILAVAAGFAALWWVNTLPARADSQQTIVVGRAQFAPGSDASVRVVVQDVEAGRPIPGAHVQVSLKPDKGRAIPLFEGETDESGSVPAHFQVPADAPSEAELVVEARSLAGQDRVVQPVTIQRDYRILLSSDKPLYQPGQIIHMRALGLSILDLTPARGAIVDFLVEDPKGNKVWRQSVTASDFGIAAADFALADMVNQGDYKLSAAVGDTRSEKTVEVRPYVLPKFEVDVSTERSYYLPGQRVEGVVQADYFFGKPVAGGQVQVVGSVWDVERTVVVELRGETDGGGTYPFALDLPAYFAGSGLESGQARFALEVTVIDQADHAEQTSQVIPVAAQPLIIEAVAESGSLKRGVENVIYLLTAYPDGRPASTQLQVSIDDAPTALTSDEYGLARFAFTPSRGGEYVLQVTARDESGLSARRALTFAAEGGPDSVLLRADRAAYLVGETMHLVALTPVQSGDVYLDIVKAGQTLSTRSAPVQDSKAEFAVDVSGDLYGSLELHAYKVLLNGTIVRDTRVVAVDAPKELQVGVTPDQDTYLPGETATLDIQVQAQELASVQSEGPGIAGTQTALGLAIVDESVYALTRQDPGFAKLYFLLEQELLEPFYQIDFPRGGAPILPASIPPDEERMRQAQDDAAKAAWAETPIKNAAQPVNSRPEKLTALRQAQREGYRVLGVASVSGLIALPVLSWAATLVALWQSGVLRRSLVRWVAAIGVLILLGGCLLGWTLATSELFYQFDIEEALLPGAALLGLALLAFAGYAWIRRDRAAKSLASMTLAWAGLFGLLIQASERGPQPDDRLLLVALLTYALLPAAYTLFGQGRWLQARRFAGILSTGVGVLSILPLVVVLPTLLFPVRGQAMLWDQGMAVVEEAQPMLGALAPMGGARAARDTVVVEKEVAAALEKTEEAGTQQEAPRLRQYFPETLYWAPEVTTDESGFVSLQVPMADSITTWRLTALASSRDGRLGYATRGIRVFQDFFVDVDLPVALTQGDEISIPVGVFNYLPQAQEVRLEVAAEPWFELLGGGEQTLQIASNEVEVVYFPVRVKAFGQQGFQVTAWGERMSDAVRRQVRVVPDGKEVRLTESDWLRGPKEITLDIPGQAVPDTARVEVKIYPGVMAQAIEGLEKILRLPHG